jgi:hypothetical protein
MNEITDAADRMVVRDANHKNRTCQGAHPTEKSLAADSLFTNAQCL